jgi:uncharacterized membrane protein (UPF0127 family)
MKIANPVSGAVGLLALALVPFLASGCGGSKAPDPADGAKTVYDHFAVSVGGHATSLQVAVLDAEQHRGLMGRPDLGGNAGMIFVNARPQQLSFWMKDTPEALDIGYLAPDGTIAEIYQLLPLDERIVLSHGDQLQFALEMPQGWFAANGIRVGTKVDMAAVASALKERGFDPAKFGLSP